MVLGMLAIPADFGRGEAVVKRISEGERPGNILATSIIFLVISLSVVVSLIFLLRSFLNDYFGAKLAIYLAIGIVLMSIYHLPMSVLKGELRVDETAFFDFGYHVLWVVLGLVFVLSFGYGVVGLIYGLLFAYAIVALIGIIRISTPLGNPSWESAKSLFNYWKYSVVSYVDTYFYNWLDIAVIGLFLTQADVGAYEIAWRVAGAVTLVSIAIDVNILPQISEWDSQDAKKQIEDVVPNAVTASLFFVIPAFFGSLLISREGLGLIFGPEYQVAWLVLIVFIGGKVVESFDRIIKNILLGMDFPNLRMRAVVISLGLNILLNIALVWEFGIIGAAVATTLSFMASTLITTYYLYPKLSLSLPYRNISWCIVASIAMAFALFAVKQLIIIDSLVSLIGFILGGGIVYVSVAIIYRPLRIEVFSVIQSISL